MCPLNGVILTNLLPSYDHFQQDIQNVGILCWDELMLLKSLVTRGIRHLVKRGLSVFEIYICSPKSFQIFPVFCGQGKSIQQGWFATSRANVFPMSLQQEKTSNPSTVQHSTDSNSTTLPPVIIKLGGGFIYFVFSSLFGEDSHFD